MFCLLLPEQLHWRGPLVSCKFTRLLGYALVELVSLSLQLISLVATIEH